MDYIELKIKISPIDPGNDILTAQLGEFGFESFIENDEGLLAYIPSDKFLIEKITEIPIFKDNKYTISYEHNIIKEQNWNKVWESNFEPVLIANKCYVRAPFHPPLESAEYDLIIEPKMSFGTAHHETTSLMIEYLLETDIEHKAVLDMGCGTGILAILAAKKGALEIFAIDNDEWAFHNTIENIERNKTQRIKVILGDSSTLGLHKFEVLIANINRNVLVKDIIIYSKCLKNKGILLLSGFYNEDLEIIKKVASENKLIYLNHKTKNNWVAAQFVKQLN